ncbi:hypothetical protein BZL54_20960, partial [Burkholderia ubonensis subsp. mesacidophila]
DVAGAGTGLTITRRASAFCWRALGIGRRGAGRVSVPAMGLFFVWMNRMRVRSPGQFDARVLVRLWGEGIRAPPFEQELGEAQRTSPQIAMSDSGTHGD